MRLAGFRQIDGALGHRRKRRLVDIERRYPAAQHGVVKLARFIAADRVGRDLAERTADAALAGAGDHRALMLQQVLCNIPAAVDGADEILARVTATCRRYRDVRLYPLIDPLLSITKFQGAAAVRAGLGVGMVPAFLLHTEPGIVPLTEPSDDCHSSLWLLAHPESRHLRRIAAVYQHFAEEIRLPD